MLKDKDYRALENEISRIYSDIETGIVRRICRQLSRKGLESLDIEDWKLRQASGVGTLGVSIKSFLEKETQAQKKAIESAVEETIEVNRLSDEKLVKAVLARSEGLDTSDTIVLGASEMREARAIAVIENARKALNLTNTLAIEASQKCFLDAVNSAYLKVMEGSHTLDDAVWVASKSLARQGLTYATYTSKGLRLVSMDAAVRRNVVTSVAQATAEMTKGACTDAGLDLVKISAHIGARPSHQLFQGKVFSLSGSSKKYPPLSASIEEGGTGYGTAGGLCGCNCRHHFYPYVEGFEPTSYGIDITPAENEEIYEASQRQRAYERGVRSWKRTLEVAEDQGRPKAIAEAKTMIRGYQAKLRDVCERYNLPREYAREKV